MLRGVEHVQSVRGMKGLEYFPFLVWVRSRNGVLCIYSRSILPSVGNDDFSSPGMIFQEICHIINLSLKQSLLAHFAIDFEIRLLSYIYYHPAIVPLVMFLHFLKADQLLPTGLDSRHAGGSSI